MPPSAHDFAWRHARHPYDLVVYQFGNSSHHDYMWPYALRYPGLVVLHDTRLHHARAALLLRDGATPDYRAELAWSQPDVTRMSPSWPSPASTQPCIINGRWSGRSSRRRGWSPCTATGAARELAAARCPATRASRSIRPGRGRARRCARAGSGARAARCAAATASRSDAVVFGCFGGLTPEKRMPQILAAMAAIAPHAPTARLLLGGRRAAHYDVHADIAAPASAGSRHRHRLSGERRGPDRSSRRLRRQPEPALADRPRDLRPLAARPRAGRPTIITDLVHTGRRAVAGSEDVEADVGWDRRSEIETGWLRTGPATSSPGLEPSASPSTSSTRTTRCGWRCGGSRDDAALRARSAARRTPGGSASIRSSAMVERLRARDRGGARRAPAPAVELPAHLRDDGDRDAAIAAHWARRRAVAGGLLE